MRDIDYYRRQMDLYNEIRAERLTISVTQFLEMTGMITTIHSPDKMSPRKKLMAHKMDMTK